MPGVPQDVRTLAAAALADLPAHRREVFELRLDRWWSDLRDGLGEVHPGGSADPLARRVVVLAAEAYRSRSDELHRLDQIRTLRPDWFQSPSMVGYAAYADRFAGDLDGVRRHIDHLRDLGITYLHLMPLLRPRRGDNDGGYAVADYRSVRPDLGTIDDVCALAGELRHAGISLVLDLVLNHVAREHAWAVAARAGDPHYRDYFHVFTDRDRPDEFERTLPEVFPDFAPGNFTWDDELPGWVWTTFNSWQWDLNWSNPDVFAEYADIVLFMANLGVEVIRLDAIAFLWKRLGTTCQNQPEVHSIVQALRALVRIACPGVVFKAEAIVGPADLVRYLGHGVHHGKVSDLAYHNSLMVQIWSSLASRDVRLAVQALRALPPTPATTAWITYIRCHDDIGWAVDDLDAAAVGLSGPAHREFLSDYYSGSFPGSPARGLVFQHNAETGDKRISGTTASLSGAEVQDPFWVERVLLAHAIAYGWGGIPVVWSGDELGMLNDPDWAAEPGHERDNRWCHRPRLDWAVAARRSERDAGAATLFSGLARLARIRAQLPHLHASVPAQVLEPCADIGVLAVLRRHPIGDMLELYNVTDRPAAWPADRVPATGMVDALTGTVADVRDGAVRLLPYQAVWLVQAA